VDLTVFSARRADRDGWRGRCRDDRDAAGRDCEEETKPELSAEAVAARELVRQARDQGLSLTGPDGLLKQLHKTVLETALDEEMTEHLGHEKGGRAGSESGNIQNDSRSKTVLTEASGQIEIEVPRDRTGMFEPQIVKKRDGQVASRPVYAGWARSGGSVTARSCGYGTTPGKSSSEFLDYDVEIRRVLCSTNAIESLNARYGRAVRARGHFPSEQAALKCLYLVTRSLDPTGTGQTRWTMRWKPALNAFAITFSDRFPAAETY
jgi:transposase-like protein